MKLIDILVEELPKRGGWPDGANFIAQDEGRATWSFINEPAKDEDDEWMENSETSYHKLLGHLPEASDYDTAIITREQYEAELAAKNDGWVEWGGGKPPFDKDTMVDIKFRSGEINSGVESGEYYWPHTGYESDIIAYRLHKPNKADMVRAASWNVYAGITKADGEADTNERANHDAAPVLNGEGLPPVGCFCEITDPNGVLIYGQGESGEVIAHVENTAVIRMSYGLGCFEAGFLRPLRTETERKREEAVKTIMLTGWCQSFAEEIYDLIAAGKVPGVKLED